MKLRLLVLMFAMLWAPATGDQRPTENQRPAFIIPAEHILRRREGDHPATLVQPRKGFRLWISDEFIGHDQFIGVYDYGMNMTQWYPRNPNFEMAKGD